MYQRHPLSAAFPTMSNDDLHELAADIKENGLENPITIYEGKIIDGWNRWSACQLAGIKNPPVVELPTDKDPRRWVLSQNLWHRHLDKHQRATAIVSVMEWKEKGASGGITVAEMAEMANVSKMTINRAKKAVKEGKGEAIIAGEAKFDRPEEIRYKRKKLADPRFKNVDYEAVVERNNEMQSQAEQLLEENEILRRQLEADDKVKESLKIIDEQVSVIRILREKIETLTNTANEAIKQAKRANKSGKQHN